ncbi:hypothetical protein [Nitratireductor pacificus]|uniref:Uncharacterized protein n=1 Tax=Nitratireductor pacificus pht-3B TaxID=391937 RepID=K2MCF6_9HYPH|nr:hypothetical protein [Nitratireductor pacificus]EKF19846.1 hypothetical protein NA2_05878 [Nitratireductor pacificus pht-3B]
METSLLETTETLSTPLELVELELALKHQDCVALGFEGTVRHALEQVEGRLLFQMRLDGADDCDWIAAVALQTSESPVFALVVQKADSGSLEVEGIETSQLPVARIVSTYADLMATLDRTH